MRRPICVVVLWVLVGGALPAAAGGLSTQVTLDGAARPLGELVADIAKQARVDLQCDPQVSAVALQVCGSGPLYELMVSLEWLTGGQWRDDQGVWTLDGPASRMSFRVFASRLTPQMRELACGPGKAAEDVRITWASQFVRSVLNDGGGPASWEWASLSDEQQQLLTWICAVQFMRRVASTLSWPVTGCARGPLVEGSRVAWLPSPRNFSSVRVSGPGGLVYTWTQPGKVQPDFAPNPDDFVMTSTVTLLAADATLAEIIPRLCPPLHFVLSTQSPDGKRTTADFTDKSLLDALAEIGRNWDAEYGIGAYSKAAFFGERPLGKLLADCKMTRTLVGDSPDEFANEVLAAIAREAPPETRNYPTQPPSALDDWRRDAFARVLSSLTDAQREALDREGSLPVSSLDDSQRRPLLLMLDLRWRQLATQAISRERWRLDLQHLSGEAESARLVLKHPSLRDPAVMNIPQQ